MHRQLICASRKLCTHACTGATLIEVMVALVILSIGLLGLASLQLSGISDTSNSEKRTQAAILANDLVERMRTNPAAVTAGDYYAALNNPNIDCLSPPANYCEDQNGTAASTCSSQQMANFDAYSVYCNAQRLLQNGSITVQCTDSTGVAKACNATVFRTVTVSWVNQTDNGSVPKNLTLTVQP